MFSELIVNGIDESVLFNDTNTFQRKIDSIPQTALLI